MAFTFKLAGIAKLAKAREHFNMMWLESESHDPLALRSVRESTSMPICVGKSAYRTQGYRSFIENHAVAIIMPDTVWNGIPLGKKVADYANTYDILFAPHNSHGCLGGWQAAQLCATLENFKILEYEYDDVPWRNGIVTHPTVVKDGYIELSDQPGLGFDIIEEKIREYPPTRSRSSIHLLHPASEPLWTGENRVQEDESEDRHRAHHIQQAQQNQQYDHSRSLHTRVLPHSSYTLHESLSRRKTSPYLALYAALIPRGIHG